MWALSKPVEPIAVKCSRGNSLEDKVQFSLRGKEFVTCWVPPPPFVSWKVFQSTFRRLKQGKSQASGNGQGYLSHSLSYSPEGPFLGRYTREAGAGQLAVLCAPAYLYLSAFRDSLRHKYLPSLLKDPEINIVVKGDLKR